MEEDGKKIVGLCLACQECFHELIDSLKIDESNGMSCTAIEDELVRFKAWAANLGAMALGRASLEHRLRDAEYLHHRITSILGDLKASLEEGSAP